MVMKKLNGVWPCGESIMAPICSTLTLSRAAHVSVMPFRSTVSACSTVVMDLIVDSMGPRNSSTLDGNLPALMIEAKPPLYPGQCAAICSADLAVGVGLQVSLSAGTWLSERTNQCMACVACSLHIEITSSIERSPFLRRGNVRGAAFLVTYLFSVD